MGVCACPTPAWTVAARCSGASVITESMGTEVVATARLRLAMVGRVTLVENATGRAFRADEEAKFGASVAVLALVDVLTLR